MAMFVYIGLKEQFGCVCVQSGESVIDDEDDGCVCLPVHVSESVRQCAMTLLCLCACALVVPCWRWCVCGWWVFIQEGCAMFPTGAPGGW